MNLHLVTFLLFLPAVAWCRSVSSRVVNGADTAIESNRHQLSLRVNDNHACSASLISSTRAVSVAHCLGLATSSYSVLAGATDRTNVGCATCALRNLISYTRHPNFDNNALQGYPNDIAVLTFSSIGSNAGTGYVAMALPADGDFADDTCTITGWGVTSPGGSQATILQGASMTAMTGEQCANSWPSTPITDGQICATSPTASACSGDDGGSLICNNKLVGAMSWVSSSCDPSFPTVFTRISNYKSWIDGQ